MVILHCFIVPSNWYFITDHTNGYFTLITQMVISFYITSLDIFQLFSLIGIACTDYTNGYFTLFPLISVSSTDHTNGYFTLFILIGFPCTDHRHGYFSIVPSNWYFMY